MQGTECESRRRDKMCGSGAGQTAGRFPDPFQPLGLIVEKVCPDPAMELAEPLDCSDHETFRVMVEHYAKQFGR
jgi:hypothetical protein